MSLIVRTYEFFSQSPTYDVNTSQYKHRLSVEELYGVLYKLAFGYRVREALQLLPAWSTVTAHFTLTVREVSFGLGYDVSRSPKNPTILLISCLVARVRNKRRTIDYIRTHT